MRFSGRWRSKLNAAISKFRATSVSHPSLDTPRRDNAVSSVYSMFDRPRVRLVGEINILELSYKGKSFVRHVYGIEFIVFYVTLL